jgi:hypothetical protein
MVGTELGLTLANPTNVSGAGTTSLPSGATAFACNYAGASMNVFIEWVANIDPSNISLFSGTFPVPYTSVSGVGDQARYFSQPLAAGNTNAGMVATKGSNLKGSSFLMYVVATATPASLARIEALVNLLLGSYCLYSPTPCWAPEATPAQDSSSNP